MQTDPRNNRRYRKGGREDRFYLVAIALFACLMASIWLWVTGDIRKEREEMWQGVLSTTARDVSSDLENGVQAASDRLLSVAQRLEREGGVGNAEARDHAFRNGFVGLIRNVRLYTPDTELRADGKRIAERSWYPRLERLFTTLREDGPLDCSNCLQMPGGRVIIAQPVRKGARTVAYITAEFNTEQQISAWEKKIDFRSGLLCLVNRKSEVLYFAGEQGQSVYGGLIGDSSHDLTRHIARSEPSFEYIRDINGVPPAYAVSQPVQNSNWQVVLIVPEATVDGGRMRGNIVQNTSLALMLLVAVVFFFMVCRHYYDKASRSRRSIDRLGFVIEGERILFSAATDTAMVEASLERIAGMIHAKGIMFKIYPVDGHPLRVFCWHADPVIAGELRRNLKTQFFIRHIFDHGEKQFIAVGRNQVLAQLRPGVERSYIPESVCAVPIRDTDRRLAGMLAVLDTDNTDTTMDVLHSMKLGFAGFLTTLRAYDKVKRMGERDALTGLLNRNSFEEVIKAYEASPCTQLICVYADANGLHDINNTLGHDEGDRLITAVGKAMQSAFGDERTFRTGGDEFVAFEPCGSLEVTRATMKALQTELGRKGFRCAFGCAALSEAGTVRDLLRKAERAMFDNKNTDGRDHRHRYDQEEAGTAGTARPPAA